MKEFLEYAESHAEDILGTLRHMVEMESFTADKASTDALGGYIKERLEELGAQVRLVPQEEVGDHLVAEVGGGAAPLPHGHSLANRHYPAASISGGSRFGLWAWDIGHEGRNRHNTTCSGDADGSQLGSSTEGADISQLRRRGREHHFPEAD